MALKIQCDSCSQELDTTGGILWSPPYYTEAFAYDVSEKIHLCIKCFQEIYDLIREKKNKGENK